MGDNLGESLHTDYTDYANMISNYEAEYGGNSVATDDYTTDNEGNDDDNDDDTYEQGTEADSQYESAGTSDDDTSDDGTGSSSGSSSGSGSGSATSRGSASNDNTSQDASNGESDDDNDERAGLSKQSPVSRPKGNSDNDGNGNGDENEHDVEAQRTRLSQKAITPRAPEPSDGNDDKDDGGIDQSSADNSENEGFDDEFGFGAPFGGSDSPVESKSGSKRLSQKLSKKLSKRVSSKKPSKKKKGFSTDSEDYDIGQEAFPSVAAVPAMDQKERDILVHREKLLLDRESNVNQRQRRFSRWMIILAVLICVGAATLVTLYLLEPFGTANESATTQPQESKVQASDPPYPSAAPNSSQPSTLSPTSPQSSAPSGSPSLPPNQVTVPTSFFGLVPNGIEEGVTGEVIQEKLLSSLNELAPQILNELGTGNNLAETRTEGNQIVLRRNLKVLSVKTPVSVEVAEVYCSSVDHVREGHLCLEVMVDVVLVTDDGTVHVNFQPAFEEAILDGRLEGILNTEDFNTTLILYLDEDELPTSAPSTNSTQEPTSTQSPAPSTNETLSPSISTDETDPDGNETDSFDDDELFNNITESPSFFNSSDLDFNETDPNEGDENVTVTMSPTEDVNVTMSPTEDVNVTMSPTEDVNGTMSPTEDVNVTMSPTEDVNGTMSPTNKTCVDKRDECKAWVEEGECDNNPKFMLLNCQAACSLCGDQEPCDDQRDQCSAWAEVGECEKNPTFMLDKCAKSCGECDGAAAPCADNRDECATWAEVGECENNPKFMKKNCEKSCGVCSDATTSPSVDVKETPSPSFDSDETASPTVATSAQQSDTLGPTSESCIDSDSNCEFWALTGECEFNDWMNDNCKKSCDQCDNSEDDDGTAARK